jgi:signal transduction histidine kinase
MNEHQKWLQSRRDFVSGMSHELKTPLAVIQASAEALEKNIYDEQEDKDNALKQIQNEVFKTNNMIKSMMNVYKVDLATYEQEWKQENIKDIFNDINSSLKMLYNSNNIDVQISVEDAYVDCNRERIETVITNLFTNAIKYTPKNGKIIIRISNTDAHVRFIITNFGTSIPKKEQGKIFDPFYRVSKSRSRIEGSTGLGLYIVDQTLLQYNSKCIVKSTNEFVSFSFKLKKVINPPD